MQFAEQLNQHYSTPIQHLKLTYAQLTRYNVDTGFTSVLKNGRDFHQITHDIVISVQKIHDNRLTNLLFTQNAPLRVTLEDEEIISYYSDYIELRYIVYGTLEVEIEGSKIHFTENDICFINSMAYHKESIRNSECMFININIRREVFTEIFLNNISTNPLQQFLRMNIMKIAGIQHYLKFTPTSSTDAAQIQDYISSIFFEVKNQMSGYLEISKGYIIRLMNRLTTGYQYNFNEADNNIYTKILFESITEYMKSSLETITLTQLSEEFHFHPNYFSNLIRQFTGLNYSQYLITLRIEKAKTLLATSNLSIEDIMWLIGYNNKGFFYKKFMEIVGTSPAKYRKEVKEINI